jgi:hypothetical protein
MRVELSTTLIWHGYEYHSGDQIELPDELAAKYIAAGSATEVTPPVETAALHTQPHKGRKDGRNATRR